MAYSFLVHGDRAALSSFPGMQESTAVWHLTAFYLAAAIFASLGSHLHSNLVALPRFLARLSSAASAGVQIPRAELFRLARKAQLNGSVGASGALYAIMAVGALSFPHAQVGIIFLPFISFPITWAVGALCLLDLVGLIRAWQMFNHAAHLSGAIFGGLYWRYGVRLPLHTSLTCALFCETDYLRLDLSVRSLGLDAAEAPGAPPARLLGAGRAMSNGHRTHKNLMCPE